MPVSPGRALAVAAVTTLALSACSGGTTTTEAAPPTSRSSAGAPATSGSSAVQSSGKYLDEATFRAEPPATGRVVLFFHAPWCPDCRRTDKNLTADPASIPADLTVVKVDFDSATELRKEYGVTQQHTFVAIGPDGGKLAIWSGSDTAAEISAKAG